MHKNFSKKKEKGQVLVIFGVSVVALLIFVGLAIDGTQLFLNYTRLKRAVDASAVAAANDFKRGSSLPRMKQSALEVLEMQQVNTGVDIKIYMCDLNGDGTTDANLQTEVPEFWQLCPHGTQLQKKLIYVRAYERSQTNFLHLIGISNIPISTTAVAEAAPVDLVIVLDTSESMGNTTTGYNPGDFNPAACNSANTCQPLKGAKDAAKGLVDQLYVGYDRVAIVTFDTTAQTRFAFSSGNLTAAGAALANNSIPLHDDPPANKLFASWYNGGTNGNYNPVNPEDRENNGQDTDTSKVSTQCTLTDPNGDRWDTVKNIPCDSATLLDAFDWNQDGVFTSAVCSGSPTDDHCTSVQWQTTHNQQDSNGNLYNPPLPMSLVSTCTGCGIRLATEQLVRYGRPNAVWVMVFLTDGVTNMSDTPRTYPYNATTLKGVPTAYPNGFCGGWIDNGATPNPTWPKSNFWLSSCRDNDKNAQLSPRRCINADPNTCPPGSTPMVGSGYTAPYSPPYSVLDYSMDMADAAALRESANANEKLGNDIVIYTIGFGTAAVNGAPLLRYMAMIGDNGSRATDECTPYAADYTHKCGQYYFAPNTTELEKVFRDIATRIYTKISE